MIGIRKIRWVDDELVCEPSLAEMAEAVLRQLTFVTVRDACALREWINR